MTMRVELGQLWQDRDPRMPGRRLRIVRIADGYAFCQHESGSGPKTRIRLDRFHTRFYLAEQDESRSHLPTDEFCRIVPEEAGAAPRHCFHPYRKGDAICCWCGDLFLDEQSTWQHGDYLPGGKAPEFPPEDLPAVEVK
jgi:hypothetical protein